MHALSNEQRFMECRPQNWQFAALKEKREHVKTRSTHNKSRLHYVLPCCTYTTWLSARRVLGLLMMARQALGQPAGTECSLLNGIYSVTKWKCMISHIDMFIRTGLRT